MPDFDPIAATNAYLATMSPAASARAVAYTQGGHWLLLWGWLVTVLAAWVIIRSGLLVRAQASLERRNPRPVLATAVIAAIVVLLDWALELPWSVYAHWWRERANALSSQSWQGWLSEQAIGTVISVVKATVVFSLLYALMRKAPRWWWAWAGLLAPTFAVLVLFLAPIYIEPLFNHYTPAPPGPVRSAIVALAQKAGVPSDKIYIYDGSRQSNRYTANVSGIFGTARIAMSDVMFKQGADIAEVRGVVGHEMGHYRQGPLWIALPVWVFATLAFGLAKLLFPLAARSLRAQSTNVADPAMLPVLIATFATLSLVGTPITNTISRYTEADADSFSLRTANEPDGLATALVKSADYRAPSPSALEEVLFYDHPSVEHRVRKAMDWKAGHLALGPPPK
jgi:STE24 endopeptidase